MVVLGACSQQLQGIVHLLSQFYECHPQLQLIKKSVVCDRQILEKPNRIVGDVSESVRFSSIPAKINYKYMQ